MARQWQREERMKIFMKAKITITWAVAICLAVFSRHSVDRRQQARSDSIDLF